MSPAEGMRHHSTATITNTDVTTVLEGRDDAVFRVNQIVLDAEDTTGSVVVELTDAPDGTSSGDLGDFRKLIDINVEDNERVVIDGIAAEVETDILAEAQSAPSMDIRAYIDGYIVTR